MPSYADFADTQLQASIYTSAPTFRIGPAISFFMSKWPNQFATIVFASELTHELPADSPRLILRSGDARIGLQAGPSRLDILRYSQSDQDKVDVAQHFGLCCEIFAEYMQAFPLLVSRAKALIRRVASQASPAASLARHFCRRHFVARGRRHRIG